MKITAETIKADEDKLKELIAEQNDPKTDGHRRKELYEEGRTLDQKIKYDKMYLEGGSKTAKNGQRLIKGSMKTTGYEISVN